MASKLPNEIWHKIFLYIDDPGFVFETLSLVCKQWYYLIRSLPEFCGYLRLDLPCEDLPSILKTWTGLTELTLMASPDDNDLNKQLTEAISQCQDLIQSAPNLQVVHIKCYQPADGYILDLPSTIPRPHPHFGISSEEFSVRKEDFGDSGIKVKPTKLMIHSSEEDWEFTPPNLENMTKLIIDDFSEITALKCHGHMPTDFLLMAINEAQELDYLEIHFNTVVSVAFILSETLGKHPKIDCLSLKNKSEENLSDDHSVLGFILLLAINYVDSCPPSLCFENFNFRYIADPGFRLPNVTSLNLSGIFDIGCWKNLLKIFPNLDNLRVQDESGVGEPYLTPVQSLLHLDLLPDLRMFMMVYNESKECPPDCSDVVAVGQKTLHGDCEVRIVYSKGKYDLGYDGDCFMKSPWHEDAHIKHQGPNAINCPNQRMH